MADQATQRMRIEAPLETIFAVLTDFESYPTWAKDIKEAVVVETDDEGRGVDVRYRAAAMGRSTSYLLRYDYANAPNDLPWELVTGDIMRQLDGAYEFEALDDGSTMVTYHLKVDLVVPLPGFVKRRAESRIVHTALRELRAHVESP